MPEVYKPADFVDIDGVEVRLGAKTYVVPALNLKALKRVEPKIQALKDGGENIEQAAAIEKAAEIVHEALKRNYPTITLDEVQDIIDVRNMWAALAAVYGQSSVQQLGEPQAPQPSANQSTGTISTAS